ncbi:hypothetical protein AB3S75_003632 [Citrus x aurantiifolia]
MCLCSSKNKPTCKRALIPLLVCVTSFLLPALAKVHKLNHIREEKMANSRIAKFVMEVAPPQFVCVMRHRTAKMLDTISEEEKDVSGSDALASTPRSFSSCSTPSSASAVVASDSKYFLRGVPIQQNFRSLRINKP